MLCDNSEGWSGMEGGREIHEGGDIRVPKADSYCYMAETNTTVVKKPTHYKAIILQLKTNNNKKMPYDPAIPLLDIHPEKTITEKYVCAPIFIVALFTIARTWKQPRCPSTNEWIK